MVRSAVRCFVSLARIGAVVVGTMCGSAALAAPNILMVTTNNGTLTSLEAGRKAQIESAGFVVNTIWDGASQATFDAAFANNRAVYVPDEATTTELAYKLREATIGVVCEHPGMTDELGFCTSNASSTAGSSVNVTNNTHYVTNVFATGSLVLGSGTYTISRMAGTTASGAQVLATVGGVNCIVAIDTGATLANTYNSSNVAFGRRVFFPIPVSVNDGSTFNSNPYVLCFRMLNWAAGLDKALVGHWKLNETSGTTAADSSGLSTSGTVTGTASWTAAIRNNGFNFDGATKIQVSGLFSNPRNISVAAWAKLTTADTNGSEIISLGDHFTLRLDEAGAVKGIMYDGSTWQAVSVAGTYAGTGWHHFAAVFDDDNNTFKLYIDGALAATASNTASINYSGLGANTVIGRQGNANTAMDFTGVIDDVRVYNYAITAAEVEALYGFVGHWKLADASGTTAVDSTVTANNGTVTGTASWSSDCGGMGVFDFNGSTNYVSVASAAALQPTESITIAAWVKGDVWGTGSDADTIVRKGEGTPNNYCLCIADGKVTLLLDDVDTAGIRSTATLNTGTWYHVAATWDGTTAKIYINGVLDSSTGRTGTIGSDARAVNIGGRSGSTDMFDGMIRDVRLYNFALDATAIKKLAGLVGYWPFSEGSGTTAADSSGQGNNATLSGGATWTSDCAGNNNALLTNGTGGIAQTAMAFDPPDTGTVAFWMRSAGAPAGSARILGLGGDWEVRQRNTGTVISDLSGDGSTTIGTVTPLTEVGRWYHFAATFNSTTKAYAIYVDGQLENSGTNSAAMSQQASAVLSFGTRTGSTEYWSGALRDVRVYNRQLCPNEIAALYGMVGYWKLDEASGTAAADSAGMGNSASLTGTSNWTTGSINGGFKFDYTNGDDYFTIPNSTTLQDVQEGNYTLAAWFKPLSVPPGTGSANTAAYAILIKPGYHIGLMYNNARQFQFDHYIAGNTWVGTNSGATTYSAGVFYHVVGVLNRTAGNCKLYVNGNLVSTSTFTAGSNAVEYGTNPWYLGIASPGAANWKWAANGIVDDARIYSRALCPTEIQKLYSGGTSFGGIKIIKWNEIQ